MNYLLINQSSRIRLELTVQWFDHFASFTEPGGWCYSIASHYSHGVSVNLISQGKSSSGGSVENIELSNCLFKNNDRVTISLLNFQH